MRVCLWLLVTMQMMLLPLQLSVAQSLRGATFEMDSAGAGVSSSSATDVDSTAEEISDKEELDRLQLQRSDESRMLTAKNGTASDGFDQHHRPDRGGHHTEKRESFDREDLDELQWRTSNEGVILNADNGTARTDRELQDAIPFQTRIIGGRDATANEHSYAVSLQDRHNNHFCGASLISKDCVLTAAHCSHQVTGKGPITAVIGRPDLAQGGRGERLRIRTERIHPRYDVLKANVEWKYDFAIMCFTRPTMTPAKIIQLNSDPNIPRANSQVTVSGWGDIDPAEDIREPSMKLQFANLRVVPNGQCGSTEGMYGSYSVSYHGYIEDDMMCAKSRKRDSCQGDSGGPLIHRASGKQVGITSWGVGCNNKFFPGVYARVSSAYGWIRRQVCSKSMWPPAWAKCEPW